MSDFTQSWKQTGKSLVIALSDLGAALCTTVKAGYDVAMDWAKTDNVHVKAEGVVINSEEIKDEPAEEAPAEPEKTEE